MQIALQISFHGLPSSESVEQDVRRHVAALEETFPRIVSCRVAIETPHRHSQQGRRYRVRVDLRAPGVQAIAGHATDEPAHEDVYLAIRDAFQAVSKQLADHAGQREHAGAAHHGP